MFMYSTSLWNFSCYYIINLYHSLAQEIQNSTKKGLPTGNIPMKVRSNAKRMDVEIGIKLKYIIICLFYFFMVIP